MTKTARIAIRAAERIAIWLVALAIAVFPALSAAHVRPSFSIQEMSEKINNAGAFRDLFFVVVVMAILSMTNIIDNLPERLPKFIGFFVYYLYHHYVSM